MGFLDKIVDVLGFVEREDVEEEEEVHVKQKAPEPKPRRSARLMNN